MLNLNHLYRGRDFSLIEKPAGLSCHNDGDCVLSRLEPGWHLVHRLDKETSGLLMITDRPDLQASLQKAIHDGEKEYVAVLRGVVAATEDWQRWDSPISDRAESRANPLGLASERVPALTLYKAEKSNAYFSFVRCLLRSGRQHQIRKHAALAGRPIVGDTRYGNPKDNERIRTRYRFARMALHAHRLRLQWKNEEIEITCPVPREFDDLFPEPHSRRTV